MDNGSARLDPQGTVALPIRVPASFRVIAHRGASAYAPENTMAAFARALELGAREVELDVQLSSDGVLMVCHDRTLDRYGHCGISVSQTPANVLQKLDLGGWFSPEWQGETMPRLDGVLDRFVSQFVYHIEIKEPSPGIEEKTATVILDRGLADDCVITSFHYECLQFIRRRWPSLHLGWLVGPPGITAERVGLAERIGCRQLCPPADGLCSKRVRYAHSLIPEVRAHHVRTPEDAWRVVQTGCDGLTVNHPDWLQHQSR